MQTKRCLWILLWLMFGEFRGLASENRWVLSPGEQRDFQIDPDDQVKISGKAIVEVERVQGLLYRVTALRAGFVYVRLLDPQGNLRRSWVIDVIPRLNPEKTEILYQDAWKEFFCQEPGIVCDPKTSLIKGASKSLVWLHRARQQCRQLVPCRFEAKLQEEGRTLWTERLSLEWPHLELEVLDDGFVRVTKECAVPQKSEEDRVKDEFKERYGAPILWHCKKVEGETLTLEFLALIHRSDQNNLSNPLSWKIPLLPEGKSIETMMEGLSREGLLQVLAKPKVRTSVGAEVRIRDGAEIQVSRQGRDGMDVEWKTVGFELLSHVVSRHGEDYQIKTQLRLSRNQSGISSLNASELQTLTWVRPGDWSPLGTIQTEAEDDQESLIPWLGDLPLLGSLFRWRQKDKRRSDLALLVRILNQEALALPEELKSRVEEERRSPDS